HFSYSSISPLVYSVEFNPVFQYDISLSLDTYTIVFPPDSYSTASSDCVVTSDENLIHPVATDDSTLGSNIGFSLPFAFPLFENFATSIFWKVEDDDIIWCFGDLYGDDPSGADSSCPVQLLGTGYGEAITESTLSVVVSVVNDATTMEIEELLFYVLNIDSSLNYVLRLVQDGSIVVQYSADSTSTFSGDVAVSLVGGSTTYLTIDTATYAIASHVGVMVSFVPDLDSDIADSALVNYELSCHHGSVVLTDTEATCECDDRWRGDSCDMCTLAYWGNEIDGCRVPNCRGRCNDLYCVAVTDDSAVCSCSVDDEDFEDVFVPNPLSRTIFYGDDEEILQTYVNSDDELENALRYGTFFDHVCEVIAGPSTTAVLRGVGVAGSVILSSAATLGVQGSAFIVNRKHVLEKSLLSSAEKAALMTDIYSTEIIWNYVDSNDIVDDPTAATSFQPYSYHRACVVSNPGSYILETDDNGDVEFDLDYTCTSGFSSRIIDSFFGLVRGSDSMSAYGLIQEFSSSECGEGQDSCVLSFPVWSFPLYGDTVHSIQLYIGTIRLLNEDGDTIGSLTPVNAEVSAPYRVYFDDLDSDSDDCSCCAHRLIVQSDIDTLSYSASVQISFYRTGAMTLDYYVTTLDSIDGRI
ncbi:hypothetical protein ADUPG1_007251, partial [Aduncisulcus paluster]